MKLIVYFI